jgi:hypothetical protein
MVNPQVTMLCSAISHMPLHFVWRDSGVTQKHGFELKVDLAGAGLPGECRIPMSDRAEKLLEGSYDFLSGLHHETYVYRAKGDKRFVYLAQAQNDWDDRFVAKPEVRTPKDLEGRRMLVTADAPCVLGNLKHSLELAGVDLDRVEFLQMKRRGLDHGKQAVEMLLDGAAEAAGVDIPFDKMAEKRGMHRLDVPTVPVIHNTTICGNRQWVIENEETTLAFLRSMIDAVHYFKTEKDRVCEILERNLVPLIGIEAPDELEYLHTTWAGLLSPKPYPHPLAVWNVYNLDVAHDPSMNFIGPFEIWDTSYLRVIDDSGYIDELYGSAEKAANPPVNAAI